VRVGDGARLRLRLRARAGARGSEVGLLEVLHALGLDPVVQQRLRLGVDLRRLEGVWPHLVRLHALG